MYGNILYRFQFSQISVTVFFFPPRKTFAGPITDSTPGQHAEFCTCANALFPAGKYCPATVHGWISRAIKWKQTGSGVRAIKRGLAGVMYELPRATVYIFKPSCKQASKQASARPRAQQKLINRIDAGRYAPLFPQEETSLTPNETVIRGVAVCFVLENSRSLIKIGCLRWERPRRKGPLSMSTVGVDDSNNWTVKIMRRLKRFN